MVESSDQPRQIFISYSRKDRAWLERLKMMLKPILKTEPLDLWDDSRIETGKNWKQEIKQALELAQVAVLLVSPHFLASDFVVKEELPPILDASQKRGLKIIWVCVSYCNYHHTDIVDYQAAHDVGKPLNSLSEDQQDKVLVQISDEIIKASRQYVEISADVERLVEERITAQKKKWDLEKKTLTEQWENDRQKLIEQIRELQEERIGRIDNEARQVLIRQQLEEQIQHLTTERDQAQAQVQALEQRLRSQPAPQPAPHPPQKDDLSSEKGIDYTRLRDLLKAGQWKEADWETARVMLKAAGRESQGFLDIPDIKSFPCTDLRTLDQLWRKYSQDRFGFSIQKQIFINVGGKPGQHYDQEIWRKFGDQVGWRVNQKWIDYSDLNFSLNASEGHLPSTCRPSGTRVGFGGGWWGYLFSRVETCKV